MISFEGVRSLTLPPAEVFANLSDASFLVSCLKDVEQIVEQSADRAVWKLQPNFSFVRAKLDITMEIVRRLSPSAIAIQILSRGIGATSTVKADIHLHGIDAGTQVHWTAQIVELTGLLKLVPKGLISSAAHKVIDDTWTEIEKKLSR